MELGRSLHTQSWSPRPGDFGEGGVGGAGEAGGPAHAVLAGVKNSAENLSVLGPDRRHRGLGALFSGCFDPGLSLSQGKEVWGSAFLRFLSYSLGAAGWVLTTPLFPGEHFWFWQKAPEGPRGQA